MIGLCGGRINQEFCLFSERIFISNIWHNIHIDDVFVITGLFKT